MEKKIFETTLGGKPLRVEIGEVAKQAGASVLTYYGDTVVLTSVVSKDEATQTDFFPLTVVYQEKLYAAGKIPGGFLRREGRPSEHETLIARLIDRPIRPMFPEGFYNEVQVINMVLSNDPEAPTEVASIFGSSLALTISSIPFLGPIAGVKVGRINGEYVLNPSNTLLESSDIELSVAGTFDAVNMV